MINYVIAAWSGLRRGKPRPTRSYAKYFEDCTIYIRFHLDRVLKLKRYISHITIVAPFNSETEPKAFREYLEGVPERISKTENIDVTVLRRENVGISFGSFSYAFEKLGDDWEYYIFNEDDHIPVREGFDADLLKALQDKKCGCVCAWSRKDGPYAERPVIGHPLSIAKSSVLKSVATVNGGKLPYMLDTYSGLSADEFSHGFYKANYSVKDISAEFRGAFVKGDGRIWWFGDKSKPPIVAPIEMWDKQNRQALQEILGN